VEMESEDIGERLDFDRSEPLGGNTRHLEPDRTWIDVAGMPSLHADVDHLRRLAAILPNDEMRADLALPHLKPRDGARIAALRIVKDKQVDVRAAAR